MFGIATAGRFFPCTGGLATGVRRATLRLAFSDGSVRAYSVASVLPGTVTPPTPVTATVAACGRAS